MKGKKYKNVLLFKALKKIELIIGKSSFIHISSNTVCFSNLLYDLLTYCGIYLQKLTKIKFSGSLQDHVNFAFLVKYKGIELWRVQQRVFY